MRIRCISISGSASPSLWVEGLVCLMVPVRLNGAGSEFTFFAYARLACTNMSQVMFLLLPHVPRHFSHLFHEHRTAFGTERCNSSSSRRRRHSGCRDYVDMLQELREIPCGQKWPASEAVWARI